jgi:hydrogenase expression/formation protein HypC
MCLGIPGKILKIDGTKATTEMFGVEREVSIMLLENVNVGDYVIVHAGSAISLIDEEEAQKTLEIFNELREIMNEK